MLLAGVLTSLFLTGCQRSEPESTGSTSAQDTSGTRLEELSPSTEEASGKTDGEASPKERTEKQRDRSAPDTSTGTSSRVGIGTFSEAEVEAAGRIYATVQEKRKALREKRERPARNKEEASGNPTKQVRRKMVRVMASAISEESNLNPPRFKSLMNQSMRDSLLRKRFFEAIRKAGGEPPSPRDR